MSLPRKNIILFAFIWVSILMVIGWSNCTQRARKQHNKPHKRQILLDSVQLYANAHGSDDSNLTLIRVNH